MVFLLEAAQIFLQTNLPMIRVRLADILDIAILSTVIYKMLWMLRKTSSGRVLRGIMILVFAMWLSSAIPLTATSFLLSKVVEWGILVLVILFQPELRRFLERMGSSRLGFVLFTTSKSSAMDLETAITETTEAYAHMSRQKVGALMVFERKNLLDDIIKTGTALDCAVSSELLKNIFWNKAPLHDGAVIVRNGRIIGAGCMLPMSGNVNLSRDLGMRHRAGIGMSEHSDAVVVIVSEETGSISAAVNGMLKRHLAPETLDRLLRNELLNETQEEKKTAQIPLLNLILGRSKKESDRP
ncbi:MAG: diadenylate cyclase CdaA [Lawsonibacter sp.]|nr:diadenylate cyclase CdaA [Lawsonibacter sp.]